MTDPARSLAGRVRWLPTIVFLVAAAAFLPLALAGQKAYAPIDVVARSSPYRDQAVRPEIVNPVQNDVPEAQAVQAAFWRDVRAGEFQLWSHATGAGAPTGALPFSALTAPLALPYLFTPWWYAPGLRAFATLLVAQWGIYLLSRHLRLGVAAATVAGVAFAFSGASVAMLQRVGAVAVGAWVIWALLRIVERPTARRAAALAALVAWSWLEGFAAATLFTLYVGGAWTVWALVLARPRTGGLPRWLGSRAAALAGGGVVAGLLVAFQALPFSAVVRNSGLLDTRRFDGRFAMGPYALFGQIDNAVIGGLKGPWVGTANSFEGVGLTGSIALVGAVVALALAAAGRLRVSGEAARVVPLLGLALVMMTVLSYSGGALLDLAYAMPGMRSNTIYRHRWFIPFFAALLLAVTLDHLWRPRPDGPAPDRPAPDRPAPDRWVRIGAGLALAAGVVVVARAVPTFREGLTSFQRTGPVARAFGVAALVAVLAAAVAAAPRWRAAVSRPAAAVTLAAVVWVQLAVPMYGWIPMVDVDRYYSSTPLHDDLRRLAGEQWRFFGTGEYTPYLNSAGMERLLDARTTPVLDKEYRDLLEAGGLPTAFALDKLKTIVTRADLDPAAPVLDELSVRYLVLGTDEAPFGDAEDPPVPQAWVTPAEASGLAPLVAPGGVAGVGVALRLAPGAGDAACTGFVRLALATADGRELGAARRPAWDVEDLAPGADLTVALTGGDAVLPEDELRLSVRVEEGACPIEVGVVGDTPAARLFTTPFDGSWRVVATRQAWVYERPSARPLVRFDDAGGTVGDVRLVANGVRASVDAAAATTVTVATNEDPGWQVRVNGERVEPTVVAGALIGVPVPAGPSDIRLDYVPPGFVAGRALSGLGVVALAALVAVPSVRDRRRRTGPDDAGPGTPISP